MKNNNYYSCVAFDCDSTLARIEGIDCLARKTNVESLIKSMTNSAMNGGDTLEKIFSERLELIKPTKKDLDWLADEYIKSSVKDAKKCVGRLHKMGLKVFIVSGGYKNAIERYADYLGVPRNCVFSVELFFDENGNYAGHDKNNPLSKNHGKVEMLLNISEKYGKTVFVGDGMTDLETKPVVDLFIGYGGVVERSVVKKGAEVYFDEGTLTPLVDYIINRRGGGGSRGE